MPFKQQCQAEDSQGLSCFIKSQCGCQRDVGEFGCNLSSHLQMWRDEIMTAETSRNVCKDCLAVSFSEEEQEIWGSDTSRPLVRGDHRQIKTDQIR